MSNLENKKRLLIAVDGPAASGKGTLAKNLAKHYNIKYLDTGSLYRALAFKMLEKNLDPSDKDSALVTIKEMNSDSLCNPSLYNEGIGSAASIVSAIPEVREALLDFQRNVARTPGGAVLDGRDIGTVVCPDADYKFFITANLGVRAERRHKELQNKGFNVIHDSVLEDLRRRDERDLKRNISPLVQAKDAFHIDTSSMDADVVLKKVLSIIDSKKG